jgi:transposase
MEPNRFRHYIGIDWATEAHRICLLDQDGRLCGKTSIPHSGGGLAELGDWLAARGVVSALAAVGIETPRGAVVETLVERGFAVFAINPKQLDRFRDRYTTGGAKDDDRDAWCIASALHTDRAAFRPVSIDLPEIIALRELYRTHLELGVDSQRQTSRLREQLRRYYPQMLTLCPAGDQPFLWDMVELAPLPEVAHQITADQVAVVLQRRRIRRLTPEQVLAKLRATPLTLAPGAPKAASEHALVLIEELRALQRLHSQTLQHLHRLLRQMRASHPDPQRPSDVEIIDSLPGAGTLTVAAVLTEASQAVADRRGDTLRTYAGLAPVTRQSGKYRAVGMRYACNQRLRDAFHHFTLASLRDPIARRHYAELRHQGHTPARALRGVGDRWVSVLIAMLRAGQRYDPTRRKAWRTTDAQEQTV